MWFGRGPVRLQLRGGTNAAFAPQIDYFMLVRTPHLMLQSTSVVHTASSGCVRM